MVVFHAFMQIFSHDVVGVLYRRISAVFTDGNAKIDAITLQAVNCAKTNVNLTRVYLQLFG